MSRFFSTFFRMLLCVVFAYLISYFCLLFAVSGPEMNVLYEYLYLYLDPSCGPLFLRILFPLVWAAAFVYATNFFSVGRENKSQWTNRMLEKPYSPKIEREMFYRGGEWISLLIPCLLLAALVPAGALFAPYYVMFVARALLFFFANRTFIALNRYVWCRDRLGGFEGHRD